MRQTKPPILRLIATVILMMGVCATGFCAEDSEELPMPAPHDGPMLPPAPSFLEGPDEFFFEDFSGGDFDESAPSFNDTPADDEPFDQFEQGPWCEDECGDECGHGWSLASGYSEWAWDWLGGRHSTTHGRAIGAGEPLRGTSWLNRPYEVASEFGALLMTGRVSPEVRSANDLFAAIQLGWDWDHYWGNQIRVGWSTPELVNPSVDNGGATDNLFMTDVSVLYYPWGDSRTRPYLRVGMGLTDLEFTTTSGGRQHEQLFTVPLAIGIKRQMKRTIVWRAELSNNLTAGSNEADSTNFITLTFGVEGRFGGRPEGYWAWHPRGHRW